MQFLAFCDDAGNYSVNDRKGMAAFIEKRPPKFRNR